MTTALVVVYGIEGCIKPKILRIKTKSLSFLGEGKKLVLECDSKFRKGTKQVVAIYTCRVDSIRHYYGTVLLAWNAIGELCRSRCRGSGLCEFR